MQFILNITEIFLYIYISTGQKNLWINSLVLFQSVMDIIKCVAMSLRTELISKYYVSLKTLSQPGLSEPKYYKSRKENPQKLTQLSSRSHPRHLVGKRTAQKDTIIDITSDSQVNRNFPHRWSPASLTFNNYFYLFLY